MAKRGRVSAAALAIAGPAGLIERPKVPHDLNDEEAEVWFSVVNRMPADWFGSETYPLLSQYCRHVIQSRRVAELIEQLTGGKFEIVDYDRLLKMQERESRAIAALAGKMRISQSTTYDKSKKKGPVISLKPWETEKDRADAG